MGVEGIGASVVRKEDRRFITGKGRYVDDIKLQGRTHAHFVRSPHAHARIKSVDTSEAMGKPGLVGAQPGRTSVDHKRVGVMYVLLAMVMLLRGFADAIMMRAQQAIAVGSGGFLPPEHYNQGFSAHGPNMIFFVAMPFGIGLMKLVVPVKPGGQAGPFPRGR